MNVKWLRRIKVTAEPTMTKDETSKYSDLQLDGRSMLFTFPMEVKSVITSPSGGQKMQGPGSLSGLRARVVGLRQHSARRGVRRRRQELGAGRARRSRCCRRRSRVSGCRGAGTAARACCMSRAIDETGAVQPTRAALIAARGAQLPLPLQRDPELERRRRGRDRAMSTSRRLAAAAALAALAALRSRLRKKARARRAGDAPSRSRAGTSASGPTARGCRRGRAARSTGAAVYEAKCLACHGEKGAGKPSDQLVGGQGTLRDAAAGAHRRQLLAVRDDGVRLHPPRDAVRAAAVADAGRALRRHRVSARS